jgi:hypothetical protein
MSRTRRTYAVTGVVAAIVTAANASQGAYFSQSWGWVALAFLVPTTVPNIPERVSAPGRLRLAFASLTGALAVWIVLSSLWSVCATSSACWCRDAVRRRSERLGHVAPTRRGRTRLRAGRRVRPRASTEPPRRGLAGRVSFRAGLVLALLAPPQHETACDECAADDHDAEKRQTGVRKRLGLCSG